MKEMREPNMERHEKISISPPPLEALTNPQGREAGWLKDVSENTEFREQVEERKKLNERLDAVISKLSRPDISLEDAIASGEVSESEVTNLYESLTGLIENLDYARAILYIPFEYLPADSWKPKENHLQASIAHFKDAYRAAWNESLKTMDVRANFVDGDVLEDEYREGDHPRVIKAAHLIPKLVEKGLMTKEEVLRMLNETKEPTLLHSLADTLPVLADMGLILDSDVQAFDGSDEYVQTKMKTARSHEHAEVSEVRPEHVTVDSIQDQLRRHLMYIDTAEYGDVTKNREDWIRMVQLNRAIDFAGRDIQSVIERGDFSKDVLERFLSPDVTVQVRQALIVGIRQAIESLASQDQAQASSAYLTYRKALITLWREEIPELHDELMKTFCHLHGLHIVSDEQLRALGIKIPALAGPFSKNLESMDSEVAEIKVMISELKKHPELSKYVYPVSLVFGSRLKGYGKQNADIDTAIFIKPETPLEQQGNIRSALKRIFEHQRIHTDDLVEFWLESDGENGLRVQDEQDEADHKIANGAWTHLLFGSAWEGDEQVVQDLQSRLLPSYFYPTNKRYYDRDARGVFLEEIERDSLQYRLMHKGYERYAPSFGGIKTPHADSIDGKSRFYDSGYRQTALKLFASRVFLPKLASG